MHFPRIPIAIRAQFESAPDRTDNQIDAERNVEFALISGARSAQISGNLLLLLVNRIDLRSIISGICGIRYSFPALREMYLIYIYIKYPGL